MSAASKSKAGNTKTAQDSAAGAADTARSATDTSATDTAVRLTTREHIAWLADCWKPHKHFLVFLFLFTLASSAVAIAYPLVFRQVIDGVYQSLSAAQPGNEQLHRLLGILALIALGRVIAGYYPGFRAWMNLRLENDVRERVFDSILQKDYTFFGKHRTGDLVTRLTDDIAEYPRIAWFGCSGIFRAVDSTSKLVFCVLAMMLLDARLALLSLIPVPIMLYVFYRVRKELRSTYRQQQEAVSRTNETIEAAFSGVRIVKAFNADTGQERRLGKILEGRVGIQLKLAKLIVLVHEMDNIASRMGQVIVLSVGGMAVLDGELSLGTLYAFYIYLDMLIFPMMDLPNLLVTARQAFVSIDREEEILRHPVVVRRTRAPERGDGSPADSSPGIDAITLRDVTFRYRPELQPALAGISCDIRRGDNVAVVGPVASGKSTLLKLLAGLLPTQEGSYAIGGTRFEDWDWPSFRRRIGYVPQESLLFSESVEENVAFGRPHDADWIRRCLEVAQMGPDLADMPDGTATRIGQRGTLVSGGQKQRIAIARALAGRPDLLLLDDCTASLDAHNEDRFWSEVERAFPEATVFVVSHRLATIRRADTILFFDGGRLVDSGTHAELRERSAVYREFLLTEERKTQLGGEKVAAGGDGERGGTTATGGATGGIAGERPRIPHGDAD